MKVVLTTAVGPQLPDLRLPDEMSRSMQKFYRRTVERFSAGPTAKPVALKTIVPKLMTRIIVNGREFESAEQMPQPYRRFYEDTLVKVLPVERAIRMVVRIEHANFIKRTLSLSFIAAGMGAVIVCLWTNGYYA